MRIFILIALIVTGNIVHAQQQSIFVHRIPTKHEMKGFTDSLIQCLLRIDTFRMIPRTTIESAVKKVNYSIDDSLKKYHCDPGIALYIGDLVHADKVLLVYNNKVSDSINVHLGLIDLHDTVFNVEIRQRILRSDIFKGFIENVAQRITSWRADPLTVDTESDSLKNRRRVCPAPVPIQMQEPIHPNMGLKGEVTIGIKLNEDGHVVGTYVMKSSGNEILDLVARQTPWDWRFAPLRDYRGKPFTCHVAQTFTFK